MRASNTLYGRSRPEADLRTGSFRPLRGGTLVLDAINTVDRHDGSPAYDYFSPGYANVLAWLVHASVLTEDDARHLLRLAQRDPRRAAAIRKRLLALRDALYRIVTCMRTDETPAAADLEIFNDEHADMRRHGRYGAVDGALRWSEDDARDLGSPLRDIMLAALDLLGSPAQIRRIGQCAGEECEWLFLDRSKNGSRRFCSASGCGNTERVRRFRERRRGDVRAG